MDLSIIGRTLYQLSYATIRPESLDPRRGCDWAHHASCLRPPLDQLPLAFTGPLLRRGLALDHFPVSFFVWWTLPDLNQAASDPRLSERKAAHVHGRSIRCLVDPAGLEPATSCLQGRRSPR